MSATLLTAVDRLLATEHDHVALRVAANTVLRRHVGYDTAVWATLDPVTLMWTHCLLDGDERDEGLERRIFLNEFREPDVCKLATLASARRPADGIHAATGGDPAASMRFRDLLAPRGLRDELRLVLTDGETAWGAVHLLRADGHFEPVEIDRLAALSRPLAGALRRSLVVGAAVKPSGLPQPPGVVELDRDGRVTAVSAEAAALLGGAEEVPQAVSAVVEARRATGRPASATLPVGAGHWVTCYAVDLAERPAVIVERAGQLRLADIIVRRHGLTARERQVVERVAHGDSNRTIARRLAISEWTVQDHLKSVFGKFGVSSRSELVAAVFFTHYLPMHDAGAVPSPRGWYLPPG